MTTPMDLLPDAPTRSDPDNFSSKGDALMTALPKLVQQFNQRLPTVDAAVQAGIDAVAAAAAAAGSAASAVAAPGTNATSTTALTVGAGVLSLVIQPNKSIVPGAMLMCARTSDPDNTWMLGQARSYTAATGALVLVVGAGDTKGSGTFSDWTLSQSSVRSSVLNQVDLSLVGASIRPSLLWDAANSKRLPCGAVYAMSTPQTYFDAVGVMQTAPAGVPVFDHDPTTGRCQGLQLWPSSTNLALYAVQLDHATWEKYNATVSANSVAAPDGTTTADTITQTASGGYIDQLLPTTAQTYTLSCYARATAPGDYLGLVVQPSYADRAGARFDLNAGTVIGASAVGGSSGVSATIKKCRDGWYRCTLTVTAAAGGAARHYIGPSDATQSNTDPFGGVSLRAIQAWGVQLEASAFATPLMLTTSASVARALPSLTMATSAFDFNALEGTLVVYYTKSATVAVGCLAALQRAGTALTDFIELRDGSALAGTPGSADLFVYTGSVTQVDTAGPWSADNTPHIFAAAYKANDFACAFDGGGIATDSSGTVPTGIDQLAVGACGPTLASDRFAGWISKIAYYPRRLSNGDLLALSAT